MSLFTAAVTAVLALSAGLAAALPASDYVLHEARSATRTGGSRSHWKRAGRVELDAIIPLRIGLTQTNLHTGYDRLMDVSSSTSPNYGKHLSPEDVHDIFAPSDETIKAVEAWLLANGIDEDRILHYENKGWIGIDLPVNKAESLFQTQYHEHVAGDHVRVGCDEYYVPKHLSEDIDYITPGIKLSPPMVKRTIDVRDKAAVASVLPASLRGPKKMPPGLFNDVPIPLPAFSMAQDLQCCAFNMTTVCQRALYNIPSVNTAVPGNEAGVYESLDFYSQTNLDQYFSTYAPYVPNGTHPLLHSVDGGEAPVPAGSALNGGESDIDIDIIQSLIWPQTMVLYQVDDIVYNKANDLPGYLNTWLDSMDGSYCDYSAFGITGDSPGIDPTYPDREPGGYKGPPMCGTYQPTRVLSVSYGEAEMGLPKNYLLRQCNEFMKLGLQGHTFLFSSGDYGVGGGPGNDSCFSANGQNNTIYVPDNPVGCPYVTSCGATQLNPDATVNDPESAMQTNLGPGAELFASAGGFSNFFPVPAFQQAAVSEYFAQHDPGHPYYIANANASNIGANGGIYNRAGRGFPDVAANGAAFRAFTNVTDNHWYGTSLAAPIWNAVITLINQERQLVGKGPVGYINTVLYENPWVLNDIQNGSNPNCGSSGFTAVPGWDPITGLGTPNYPEMLALFLSLP